MLLSSRLCTRNQLLFPIKKSFLILQSLHLQNGRSYLTLSSRISRTFQLGQKRDDLTTCRITQEQIRELSANLNENKTSLWKKEPEGYFSSLFQTWRAPAPALVFGVAGLIPFIAAPSYLYFYASSFHPLMISAQLAYGAVILSFVGGIRWGFVLPYKYGTPELVTWRSILQSTVPSMIAWGGILLPDLTAGLVMVSSGLTLALYNDLRLFGDYPKWMLGLRCLLTTVAVAMLIFSIVLVEENRMKSVFGGRVKNKLLDKET